MVEKNPRFIVVYDNNQYKVIDDVEEAVNFANLHSGKLYLLRYHWHNDELLPQSTPVEV